MFAVVGTFFDFSGDAQTCIAKQQHRVLMTFNLTQAIIDKSPPGLIVTPGNIPERSATILLELLKKENTLDGQDGGGARRHHRVERRERARSCPG